MQISHGRSVNMLDNFRCMNDYVKVDTDRTSAAVADKLVLIRPRLVYNFPYCITENYWSITSKATGNDSNEVHCDSCILKVLLIIIIFLLHAFLYIAFWFGLGL